jgi:hypothetical protein
LAEGRRGEGQEAGAEGKEKARRRQGEGEGKEEELKPHSPGSPFRTERSSAKESSAKTKREEGPLPYLSSSPPLLLPLLAPSSRSLRDVMAYALALEEFCPHVLVCPSFEAEELCRKNNLSAIDLFKPFSRTKARSMARKKAPLPFPFRTHPPLLPSLRGSKRKGGKGQTERPKEQRQEKGSGKKTKNNGGF